MKSVLDDSVANESPSLSENRRMPLFTPFRLWLGATLVLGFLLFYPLLAVGYIGDDLNNSFANGWYAYEKRSLLDGFLLAFNSWLKNEGRFFPVSMIYGYVFWHYFPSEIGEKIVQIGMVLINVATFAVFAKGLARSWTFGMLAALLALMTFQVRFWYDGIAAYSFLVPVVLEFTLLGIIFWMRSFESPKIGWPIAAIAVWLLGLLTYEISYGLTLISLYLIARYARPRQKLYAIGATVGILGALVLFDVYLRHMSSNAGSPYAIAMTGGSYLRALQIQLLGAIPLTYSIARPFGLGMPSFTEFLSHPRPQGILVACAGLGLGFFAMLRCTRPSMTDRVRGFRQLDALFCGAVLWIVPSAVNSLAARWQGELQPGLAYICVYIEYYGVALIVASLLAPILRYLGSSRRPERLTIVGALAFGFAIILYSTAQSNAWAYDAWMPIYTAGRVNLERSLQAGVLADVPDDSSIVMDGSYLFNFDPGIYSPNVKYLLMMYSGHRYAGISQDNMETGKPCIGPYVAARCPVNKNLYRYTSQTRELKNAWVSVAHVVSLEQLPNGKNHVFADRVRIFAAGASREQARLVGATFVRAAGKNGALYDLDGCPPLPSDDLGAMPAPPIVYGPGFYGPEQNATGAFEWAGPNAGMSVQNATALSAPIEMQMTAYALTRTRVTFTIGRTKHSILSTAHGTPVRLQFRLPPSGQVMIGIHAAGGVMRHSPDPRLLAVRISAPIFTLGLCSQRRLAAR